MTFFESLPLSCPDSDALPCNGAVYRLVSLQPCNEDFLSHRELSPTKRFSTTECIARSLSVFDNKQEARNLLGLPRFANKAIAEVDLIPLSGVIKKTGNGVSHFSWWRASNFSVLDAIKEVSS